MKKKMLWRGLLPAAVLACTIGLVGCSGDDGTNGAPGLSAYEIAVASGSFTPDPTLTDAENQAAWLASTDPTSQIFQAANVEPEACATCHTGDPIRSGQTHQNFYDDLFQLGVVTVSGVTYSFDGVNDVVDFQMTKNGANFDCTQADALNIYFVEYTGVNDAEFTSIDLGTDGDPDGDRLSIKGTLTYDGVGGCTSTKATSARGDLSGLTGIVAVYGQDESVAPIKPELVDVLQGAHITLARFPFAAIQELGAVNYVSAANSSDCEKCHISPYFKHGYIVGDVGQGVGDLDFYTCKVCHVDNGSGGHEEWQLMANDPQRWAEVFAGDPLTAAEELQYAYTTRLMNDVHMSHAMEFPYPQSMRNCNTCHSGKLAQTLDDANFVIETCKSCHPVTGGTDTADANGNFAIDTRPMALETLLPHDIPDPAVNACNDCHGLIAPSFTSYHSGYDPVIYNEATGTKYADNIITTIDSVTQNGNVLDITFSAAGALGAVDSADMVPEVLVSFYGYGTKDIIVSNHTSDANGLRMEFEVGVDADNALFTTVANNPGSWEVTLDMAAYAQGNAELASIPEMIASGMISKGEVAVLPRLLNGDGDLVALNAPSVTIDLTNNAAVVADYFSGANALVSVTGTAGTKGCNSCHDQLAANFHNTDSSRGLAYSRGGNIVVCRMCHVVTSGGSHLEGQSRSIDSYAHAVHSFQAFDVDRVDFTDPVEAAHYEEHIAFLFPDFAIVNCMACHTDERAVDNGVRAAFDIPDQSRSMPGLLSPTDEVAGRNIPVTPEVATGPAARACGGCHRARLINADNAGGFAAFNKHTKDFGYRIENDADDTVLYTVIKNIMAMFQ